MKIHNALTDSAVEYKQAEWVSQQILNTLNISRRCEEDIEKHMMRMNVLNNYLRCIDEHVGVPAHILKNRMDELNAVLKVGKYYIDYGVDGRTGVDIYHDGCLIELCSGYQQYMCDIAVRNALMSCGLSTCMFIDSVLECVDDDNITSMFDGIFLDFIFVMSYVDRMDLRNEVVLNVKDGKSAIYYDYKEIREGWAEIEDMMRLKAKNMD
jgi:hypothetical protein